MTDQQQKYEHIWLDGYQFDMGRYFSKGFNIWSKFPFGFLFHLLIAFVMILVSAMILGFLMAGTQSVIVGFIGEIVIGVTAYSLFAGLFTGANQISRNGSTDFGTLFSGINDFGQISLVIIAQMVVLMVVSLIAGLLFASEAAEMLTIQDLMDPNSPYAENPFLVFTMLPSSFWWKLAATFGLYLFFYIIWQFSIPFVVIERLKFWDAMETSRKVITPKFFQFLLFGLAITVGAIIAYLVIAMVAGGIYYVTNMGFLAVIVALVGICSLIPIVFAINYAAFEHIVLDNISNMDDMIDTIGSDTDDEPA